jgi:DNA-binding transcriptional MerR regulator
MSDERGRLKISELAEEAGVPVATVRHYLREGLLPEGEKTSPNMAYYPPELVERIRLIKQLQEERYMPLRVIAELLPDDGADPERLQALLETEERLFELALADERERVSEAELAERSDTPPEVVRRLAELGVIGPEDGGFSPSDARIVEAIARFRAGGYDERIGFTVHDAARFLDPLEQLATREASLLTEKLAGRFEQEQAIELFEAGVEPLRALIAAMHTKLLAREIQRRRRGGLDPASPSEAAELD